jgi:hypothetical protein
LAIKIFKHLPIGVNVESGNIYVFRNLATNPTKQFISAILKKQVAIWQKLAREKQKNKPGPGLIN